MISKDWEVTTAEKYCLRVTDGTHDSPKRVDFGKKLITSKHMNEFSLDFQNAYLISDVDYKKINQRSKIDQFDIIFSMIGTVGNLYLEKSKKIDYAVKNVGIFKNKTQLDALWLYYYLKSSYAREYLHSHLSGSTQQYITLNSLRNYPIINPDQNTKRHIVNILSSLDDKIELNNKINKNLEEIAQTLYKQWFVDFEFPNEDGEPYKSSGGEMVESELGLIPKVWKVKTIDEITIFNKRGIAPKYTNDGSGIPVINQRCIRNHTIIEEAVQYHDPDAKKTPEELFQSGWDVLINSMGVGTLGRVSVSSKSHNKLVHSCITILRSNTEMVLYPIFAYMILSLEEKLIHMGEGSTGQTSLNNKLLGQMKVAVPPIKLQENISNTIESLQKLIDKNYLENDKLAKTRDELLPKLMNGEIEVPIKE